MTHLPGAQLRGVVEAVLRDLTDDVDAQLITDRLCGALANTAARGETCHLTPAVTAIRLARRYVEAGHRQDARQALGNALACLPKPVTRPVHRVVDRTSRVHAAR
jgi:hypothetical protein